MISRLSINKKSDLTREERIKLLSAIQKAQRSFWSTLTQEIGIEKETILIKPEAGFSFDYGCEKSVLDWYTENKNKQIDLGL